MDKQHLKPFFSWMPDLLRLALQMQQQATFETVPLEPLPWSVREVVYILLLVVTVNR